MSDVFYLGVYIEIEHKAIEEYEPYVGCPNNHFLEDNSVNFCPECGEKIIEKQDLVSTKYDFDYYDLFEPDEEIDDTVLNLKPTLDITCDEFTVTDAGSSKKAILIVNQKSSKYGSVLDEETDYGAAPLDFDKVEILEKFNKEYGYFLDVLRVRAEAVSINFGLVHWYW